MDLQIIGKQLRIEILTQHFRIILIWLLFELFNFSRL